MSDTFGSALWVLDTLFEAARVGVDGVNIHTRPSGVNSLFTVLRADGRWQATVHPEYYGLMLFAQAAPPGARLLRIAGTAKGRVHVWATRAGGRTRVVLINQDLVHARTITLRILAARATGSLEMLRAPGVQATGGVTLGGQSFGSRSLTGLLAGPHETTPIGPTHGLYTVTLPAATAAMITVP